MKFLKFTPMELKCVRCRQIDKFEIIPFVCNEENAIPVVSCIHCGAFDEIYTYNITEEQITEKRK